MNSGARADQPPELELVMAYRVVVQASQEQAWLAVSRVGGEHGWYFADRLWRIRGFFDRLSGGVGMRRGRPDPRVMRPGDPVDFWRVVQVDEPQRLLLKAEMNNPGEVYLELRCLNRGEKLCEMHFIIRFTPSGRSGVIYWYSLVPLRSWIFKGMLRGMAQSLKRPILEPPQRFYPGSRYTAVYTA